VIEELLQDPETVARRAAALIAQEARAAARARGRFLLAVSGGATPSRMLELLATQDVPWRLVQLFQVDERSAPASDPARNLKQLRACLIDKIDLPEQQLHAMSVEDQDLAAAATRYATTLTALAGAPPVLDLVQLGLGADGHTASLVAGDAALDATAEVAATGAYQGHRRMTLTYPPIDRARLILWVVTGAEKAPMLSRLRRGDRSIPAGRVEAERAVLLADAAAAGASPEL
jgi:6-phosphogluconolactonase